MPMVFGKNFTICDYLAFCFLTQHFCSFNVFCCYEYPPGKRNPCLGRICNYGATCQPSLDGSTARCQCPLQCNSYGDNVGGGPVCGSDGIDYVNLCEMKKRSCRRLVDIPVKYYGVCGTSRLTSPSFFLLSLPPSVDHSILDVDIDTTVNQFSHISMLGIIFLCHSEFDCLSDFLDTCK